MTHLHKLRKQSVLKWVSPNFVDGHKVPLWTIGSMFRFYGSERIETCDNVAKYLVDNGQNINKISRATVKGAQAALLEYLHITRSIPFTDAENMSVNSPRFLEKLLQKVDNGRDIGWSTTRFLRYHPINEFEPFFESLGLTPYEFIPLLPRGLMFLSDNNLLLDNYFVLCNYGIPRNKIGKIYMEAREIFGYNYGVLTLKLEAYEQLGLSQFLMCKVVACSPSILIGEVNVDFVKVVDILREGGIELIWIEGHLLENSYNWSKMLAVVNLFRNEGYSEMQLGGVISKHPGILFESSGNKTLSLIGFLFKFGSSMTQICSIFLQFPHMQVGDFFYNLRRCFLLLTEIEMDVNEIGKIIRSHLLLLGSFTLKKTNSILRDLNVGKKRLRKLIQENPQGMKRWEMGLRVEQLPNGREESKLLKTKFLLDMGLVDDPNKTEKALKVFRGGGTEIQERFDCIMKAGLDRKDVFEMIRKSPEILNQKKEVIEKKIDFFVNDLGYPISYLVSFPSFLKYTKQRVKLRTAMYNWLKEQGTLDSELGLSTVIVYAENLFVSQYVRHHPRGLEVWQDLKNKIYY